MKNKNPDVDGLRPPLSKKEAVPTFFEDEPDWKEHWWGMPVFEMEDCQPAKRVTVNFLTLEDFRAFAKLIGVSVTRRTDSTWYPARTIARSGNWVYVEDD